MKGEHYSGFKEHNKNDYGFALSVVQLHYSMIALTGKRNVSRVIIFVQKYRKVKLIYFSFYN